MHRPRLSTSATWTAKPRRPPQSKEVLATALFGREPSLELLKSTRIILHFGDHTTCWGYLSQVHTQFRRYRAGNGGATPNADSRALPHNQSRFLGTRSVCRRQSASFVRRYRSAVGGRKLRT